VTADVRFTDEALAYEQQALWPDDWALEPPPAGPEDDGPLCRLAYVGRRIRTVADLPDITEYRAN
jgi:hypothetical protein